MSDLEMTKLCAEAMGLETREAFGHPHIPCMHYLRDTSDEKGALNAYDPLHDDAQAMALLKRFRECVYAVMDLDNSRSLDEAIEPEAYNRAIVTCVAKMQAAEGKTHG